MNGSNAQAGRPGGDRERDRFRHLLDTAERQSRTIPFWWRDDDAEAVTPHLEQLLALARRYSLPLALAVIPKGATAGLAARLAAEPNVAILQHGWQHKRHSPERDKKMELGDHRPLPEILDELRAGFERLTTLFPAQFIPALVPPWNRIGTGVNAARASVGLSGLSLFGREASGDPYCVNTHLDVFTWKLTRVPLTRDLAYEILCRELDARLAVDEEPIGILTHHLVHPEESWALLDELFETLADHPAVSWPPIHTLFDLPAPVTPPLVLRDTT